LSVTCWIEPRYPISSTNEIDYHEKKHDMPLILHYKAHKKYSKYDVLKMLCMQGHKKI